MNWQITTAAKPTTTTIGTNSSQITSFGCGMLLSLLLLFRFAWSTHNFATTHQMMPMNSPKSSAFATAVPDLCSVATLLNATNKANWFQF